METPKQPLMLYVNDKICLPKPAAPGVFVPASPEAAAALDAKDAEIARLRAALERISAHTQIDAWGKERPSYEATIARAALRKNC
jgi:hypothetical protein